MRSYIGGMFEMSMSLFPIERNVFRFLKGSEFKIGSNFRFAPYGNRTSYPIGRFPHYHRRVVGPDGNPVRSQGLKRHRPFEKKEHDESFWDRF